MTQLSLFGREAPEPPRRPPDPAYIRKSLNRLLRTVRDAQIMPWSPGEAESREKLFPQLAALLQAEESAPMVAEFSAELARLRAVG